ncbi:MAG: ABC transporter permease [Ignavibacteriaceae bacterium]|nr:ABC transporter permease [Ignavibacteriaceae bacterium]
MKKVISNRVFLFSVLILILVFRFEYIINSFLLLFYFIKLFFTDYSIAAGQCTLNLFDCFLSAILIIILPAVIVIYRKSLRFLNSGVSFSSITIIILFILYVFAPLITTSHPEFQKNINVTKLLPPLSSVDQIHSLKNHDALGTYFSLKQKVIKNSFDDNLLFADSIKKDSVLSYFQKGQRYSLLISGADHSEGDFKISRKHFLLGTDEFGRDIFSRLVYGARISITIGILSVLITFILGSLLGFFAGFTGGILDSSLNRLSEMFLSFPVIFLIILIIALFGNSIVSIIIVLGFSGWMGLFKIVRGEIITLKEKDYFLTAKLLGVGNFKLIFSEMLPVISAPVIVNLIFQFGNVILAESALSYLGLGTGGIYPSWGGMIESGQSYITHAWWMILFPGLALFFTLFMTNSLGNRIKIVFNPRVKK